MLHLEEMLFVFQYIRDLCQTAEMLFKDTLQIKELRGTGGIRVKSLV